jgi:uncharacterized oligopeptide transporter (OPT) family protein
LHRILPSAAAFGLAWTIPWHYSFLFFVGGLLAYVFSRRNPQTAEQFTCPVASGIIAGGSLMGVLLVLWENAPALLHNLLQK